MEPRRNNRRVCACFKPNALIPAKRKLAAVCKLDAVGMHPVLSSGDHPLCRGFIKRLEDCHRENRFLKFFGRCNECKRDLDRCLSKELLLKRELNYQGSGARRMRSTPTTSPAGDSQ
jgi:hypothetical protein